MFIGREFESSNAFIAYPFTEASYAFLNFDQHTPDYVGDGRLPADAFLDIAFVTGPDIAEPLYLRSLCYEAYTSRVHMTIGRDVTTVEDLEYCTTDGALEDGYETLTFVIAPSGREMYTIPGSDTQARAIITSALVAFLEARGGYASFIPATPLVFDASVIDRRAARLESIAGPETPIPPGEYEYEYEYQVPAPLTYQRLTGDVELLAGYNIAIQRDSIANGLIIGAAPGAGAGIVPCADEPASLYTGLTTQLGAGDHDIQIVGDDCYEITPESANTLVISGGCDACCDCEDYLAMLDEIARIRAEIAAIARRITKVVADYHRELDPATCRHLKIRPVDRSILFSATVQGEEP